MDPDYENFFKEICMRMIYLKKEIEKIVGKEKALEIIGKANENALIQFTKEQLEKVEPIEDFEDFKKFQREAFKSPFLSNIVKGIIKRETSKEIESYISNCLWYKTFNELEDTELGYVMCCHPDFAVASQYHPDIKLERTKTLMRGDKYCNHTYIWQK